VTGLVPVRVFPYRRRFTCESSKTFHFFRSTLRFCESRICNSDYLRWRDVRQVREILAESLNSGDFRTGAIPSCVRSAVSQRRPIADLCLQLIAGANRADTGRCSGQNYVAWNQRRRLAGERNDLRDGINHLTRARLLSHLAILPKFDREIANIDIGIHERPNWRVSVE
jgi:hypothetical protein